MKVNVEIDCTPEEARRFMGLPDLSPVHEKYVAGLVDALGGKAINPELIEQLMRNWTPMGEAGMNLWRDLLGQIGGTRK
ncbi:DUF6489 family protein [Sphingomonas sp. C3-2]|uniref:DUF6489 family protein n=1 Tax=Sphingomonas sp. C3-2 TaxID=3062169 RepID=UPI00294AFDF6|nr:DUF6489 family protein [Sphingomonas sp. C3-2]WOK35169.1 DUF6489 family protein [Sphingomonas sp. C3-2]